MAGSPKYMFNLFIKSIYIIYHVKDLKNILVRFILCCKINCTINAKIIAIKCYNIFFTPQNYSFRESNSYQFSHNIN